MTLDEDENVRIARDLLGVLTSADVDRHPVAGHVLGILAGIVDLLREPLPLENLVVDPEFHLVVELRVRQRGLRDHARDGRTPATAAEASHADHAFRRLVRGRRVELRAQCLKRTCNRIQQVHHAPGLVRIGRQDEVRRGLGLLHRIAHRACHTHRLQHLEVVFGIADGGGDCLGLADRLQQDVQAGCLGRVERHDVDGRGQALSGLRLAVDQCLDLRLHSGHVLRAANHPHEAHVGRDLGLRGVPTALHLQRHRV
mmetsp:Transcript_34620/g.98535  ORF Transcript_34620/g.98535 Transcript_34620/m.98535 type:complete len:256 (-) Transcript_34620:619-1386(-)